MKSSSVTVQEQPLNEQPATTFAAEVKFKNKIGLRVTFVR